ncbi:MAG: hypothetical protein B6I36_05930 [Desulfobacteraceae bacterium 4572_35.1]|nr:MAG: hypothetical protein B6I36_05930 [Desulfobacteraceae bacterium 4572_35.1]
MLRFFILIALLIALIGCGTVGPVQPLLKSLPQAADNATLEQKGGALLLGWDIPTTNQDGSELTDLAGFAIYKSDYDLERGCPECRPPKKLLRKIDLAYYRSNNRGSNRFYLWDSAVEEETGYRYKIVPYTSVGHEGGATLLYRPCFSAPYPPTTVSAQPFDRQVRLGWQAVDEKRQGVELVGYNVYRCSGDDYFGVKPLNSKPIKDTGYDDINLTNGTKYTYALRTVVAIGDKQLESIFSTTASARPQRPE